MGGGKKDESLPSFPFPIPPDPARVRGITQLGAPPAGLGGAQHIEGVRTPCHVDAYIMLGLGPL